MPLLSETEPTSDEYETVGAPDSQHEGVTMDDVPPGILSNYFSNILNIARAAALKSRQYNSNKTRHDITLEFEKAFDGKTPYEWQVDVTEALLLRLDCIVIAGTGAGKTMPFAMPLLLDKTKRKMVIVVSPLKELQKDQVSLTICQIGSSCVSQILLSSRRPNASRKWVSKQWQSAERIGTKSYTW